MEVTENTRRASITQDQLIRQSGWSGPASFTADDVLNAYEKGRRKEREEAEQMGQCLMGHLSRAMDEAERFYLDMRAEHHITPKHSYLRVVSLCPFAAEALYLVSEEEFISDAILNVYSSALERSDELLKEVEEEIECFHLTFRLLASKESTNQGAIETDFAFKYERDNKSTSP